MIAQLRSALLLAAACFAILSLFGRIRQDSGRSTEQQPPTDDESALFVG